MCRMLLGITSRPTTVMDMFFADWSKTCNDGFGYWVKTTKNNEYILKAPSNEVYKTHKGIRSFMLHCRQQTTGDKEPNGNENHPYLSENNRLLLSHNGHVTNIEKDTKMLIRLGHKFKSHVDSEFLLHSLEYILQDRKLSVKTIKEWIDWLNDEHITGSMNVLVLDRTSMDWFAYSDGSIEVMKPIDSNDIFIGSSSYPFGDIPIFKFDLKTGYAILGNNNKIKIIKDVGRIGYSSTVTKYGYDSKGNYGEIKNNENMWWSSNWE